MKSDQARALKERWGARAEQKTHLLFLQRPMLLVSVDLLLGFLAYGAAWLVRLDVPLPLTQTLLPSERWGAVSHHWPALMLTQVFFLFILGLYDDLRNLRIREIVSYTFLACLLQVISITSGFYFSSHVYPRSVILLFDCFNFLLLACWRVLVKAQVQKQRLRVLILGEAVDSAANIAREIERSPWMGMRIVGLVVEPDEEVPGLKYPILGRPAEIEEIIPRFQVDQIIFVSRPTWKDGVLNSLSRLQEASRLRIAILPSVYEIVIGRLRHVNIHDTPLIEVRRNPNEPFERFSKRLFDVALSVLGLLLLSPLLVILAVAIKITSPGPVFYLQARVGRGGEIFYLVKFRTMIHEAERSTGPVLASREDPRITAAGRWLRRFRLDELPQLFNVLKGDMSFVGPRPERPGFVRRYEQSVPGYSERHKVKPGISGLAQVRSYYDTSPENKLRYDLAYIYNYSFSLDLIILLETIKVILVRRGS